MVAICLYFIQSTRRTAFGGVVGACAFSQYLFPNDNFLPYHWPLFIQGMLVFRFKTNLMSRLELLVSLAAVSAWGLATNLPVPAVISGLTAAALIIWVNVASRFSDWLGNISYSLYLFHNPIGTRLAIFPAPRIFSPALAFGASIGIVGDRTLRVQMD